MNLTKTQKIGIGILTFMPILCVIAYVITIFSFITESFASTSINGDVQPDAFFSRFALAFVFIGMALITGLISLIIHIIHVTKNEKLKKQNNGQLIWILIIILANGIGGIIYYFMEILPEHKTNDVSD